MGNHRVSKHCLIKIIMFYQLNLFGVFTVLFITSFDYWPNSVIIYTICEGVEYTIVFGMSEWFSIVGNEYQRHAIIGIPTLA